MNTRFAEREKATSPTAMPVGEAFGLWLGPGIPSDDQPANFMPPRLYVADGIGLISLIGMLEPNSLLHTAKLIERAASMKDLHRLTIAIVSSGTALVGLVETATEIVKANRAGLPTVCYAEVALGGSLLLAAACQFCFVQRDGGIGAWCSTDQGRTANNIAAYLPSIRRGACLSSIMGHDRALSAELAVGFGWADAEVDGLEEVLIATQDLNRDEL